MGSFQRSGGWLETGAERKHTERWDAESSELWEARYREENPQSSVEGREGSGWACCESCVPLPWGAQMASHIGEEGNGLRAWPPKPTVVVLRTLIVHGGPETPRSACWL